MIITFSRHADNPGRGADRYRALTDYMDAPVVEKPLADGRRHSARRDPAPEILLGHGDLLRLSIRTMPFRQKYRSGVLSFAAEDVDIEAFNVGDPMLRWQVDLA